MIVLTGDFFTISDVLCRDISRIVLSPVACPTSEEAKSYARARAKAPAFVEMAEIRAHISKRYQSPSVRTVLDRYSDERSNTENDPQFYPIVVAF